MLNNILTNYILRVAMLIALITFSTGCMCPKYINSRRCNDWISDFWSKDRKALYAEFYTYTAQEQFDVYLCSQQCFHPSWLEMVDVYAKCGKSAVDTLVAKLNETESVLVVRDIVYVFEQMVRLRTYDVANDKTIIKAIDSAMARMPDTIWRQYIEKNVRYIKMSSPENVQSFSVPSLHRHRPQLQRQNQSRADSGNQELRPA